MTRSVVAAAVEAVLFVAEKPVSRNELAKIVGAGPKAVSDALSELGEAYDGTGLRLQHEGDDWQIVHVHNSLNVPNEQVEAFADIEMP